MYFQAFYEKFKNEFVYLKREDEQLPSPLTCDIPDSMEHDTIVRRIPTLILKRVVEGNAEYIKEHGLNNKLEKIKNLFINADTCSYEMLENKSDEKYWNFLLTYFNDRKIKIANNAWLFNEFYFYQYLLNAFNFEETLFDFFFYEKENAIIYNKAVIEQICTCAKKLIELYTVDKDRRIFFIFFFMSLWSNQYDCSWNESKNKEKQNQQSPPKENINNGINKSTLHEKKLNFNTDNIDSLYNSFYFDKILCNNLNDIYVEMSTQKNKRLDIILDNMGVELITDLCLLYFMSDYFENIIIHVKKTPVFVSDTMGKDIHYTLGILCNDEQYPTTKYIASKWKEMIDKGIWKIR
ncbi:conserved protein, unknown function, partial [Hepatocystis sp. ex Piliocolobus tephrosceles]